IPRAAVPRRAIPPASRGSPPPLRAMPETTKTTMTETRPFTRTTTSTLTTRTMKTTLKTRRRMTSSATMRTDQRRGVTARTRILAWIMLVLTIAVFVIVLSTARAELSRVKVQANEELQHEADKFRNFASKPDPSDGRPYTSVQKLMTNHLQTN